jgi:hypothetical protein
LKDQKEKLAVAAAALSSTDRTNWEAFLLSFREFRDSSAVDCVHAPVHDLQVFQGRAQAAAELYKLLSEARIVAEKIATKRK